MPAEDLPEGTDAIVTGAGVDASDLSEADQIDDAAAAMTTSAAPAAHAPTPAAHPEADLPQTLTARVESLKGQASERARSFVADAKDRATGSIDDVVRMIHDAAGEVDDKIGSQYGDYVRRAADSVAGLSDALKSKEVDDLFADGRDMIKNSPGVAIGIAAALGFVVARLAKAGMAEATTPAKNEAA